MVLIRCETPYHPMYPICSDNFDAKLICAKKLQTQSFVDMNALCSRGCGLDSHILDKMDKLYR